MVNKVDEDLESKSEDANAIDKNSEVVDESTSNKSESKDEELKDFEEKSEISDLDKVKTTSEVKENNDEPAPNKVIEYPSVVVVFATAVIKDSAEPNLSQSEIKNLEKLIFRENHLKVNIRKFETGQYFTTEIRKNHFKHSIELRLHVSTKNLWEGARSYVWRHFGQNEWSKGNGSTVVFNRIHVKD